MICFQDLFFETTGKPEIFYKGNVLVMGDDFPLEGCRRLRIVRESTNSKNRQGAYLCVNGNFVFKQYTADGFVFWEDTAPEVLELEVDTAEDTIEVRNVWDHGDGVMESGHNGAAIIVEEIPNGRRYRCNDGKPDDDFDDIIFRIERVT